MPTVRPIGRRAQYAYIHTYSSVGRIACTWLAVQVQQGWCLHLECRSKKWIRREEWRTGGWSEAREKQEKREARGVSAVLWRCVGADVGAE